MSDKLTAFLRGETGRRFVDDDGVEMVEYTREELDEVCELAATLFEHPDDDGILDLPHH